tara:strand:- start:2366 stop:2740 length:375 start_codon:yes stop_codon:yes gene_type:complete
MKADSSPDCIVFGRLLQIGGRSFQAKLESGKKSLSEKHSNLDWPEYRRFVQIEAGKTQECMYPQKLLQWRRRTFQEKPNHKNHCRFFPDKIPVGTGRNRLVSLRQLALIGYQQWSHRWLISVLV